MSKRKGLSVEEKRTRMLQIFHEKKDFFQLKELEKIAPKEKGIIVQSVKEIVQSLVDDGLVDTDKIGTSIYFWSYPSKAMNTKKRKLEDMEGQVEENTKKLRTLTEKIIESKMGKDESEERTKALEELTELKAREEELTKELQMYKDQDPEVYEKMKEDIKKIKLAANVWTDNIFAIRAWCKKKFFIDESTLDKQFAIPADLDYLD